MTWLVADAVPFWLISSLIEEGALPAFSRMASEGFLRPTRPPWPNCQTPPALATLLTGATPSVHGITGFRLPVTRIDAPEPRAAFSSQPRAELIWEAAGAEGRRTLLVHVPWAIEGREQLPPGCDLAIGGFAERRWKGRALEVTDGVQAVIGGSPVMVEVIGNGLRVRCASSGHTADLQIGAERWQTWCPPRSPAVRLAAARRAPDGQMLLLHTGSWSVFAGPGDRAHALADFVGPFVGEGLGRAYRDGLLGPRLSEGGGGSAERLFLLSVAEAARYFRRSGCRALAAHPAADLAVLYQPCVDDVGHEILGWCDPASPAFRPDIVDLVRPFLRQACQLVDDQVRELLERWPDRTLVVSSDHGMAGISHVVHVNEVFRQAGLLQFKAGGEVDPTRTAIAFSPSCDGSVMVNDTRREGGWVSEDLRSEMLARAEQALVRLVEPETHRHVVHRLAPIQTRDQPTSPDAHLMLAPGFHPTAEGTGRELVVPSRRSGGHLVNTGEPALRGIWGAHGPTVARDSDDTAVDSAEVAAAVAGWLGLKSWGGALGRRTAPFVEAIS